MESIKLPLEFEGRNINLYVQKKKLESIKFELEEFTNSIEYFNTPNFSRKVLFPYELKSNNAIEGYNQDLSSIINIVNNPYLKVNRLEKEYRRILNLYRGYEYILSSPEINEENLYNLYKLLSKELLDAPEKLIPYNKYRHDDVYIHYSNILTVEPDKGVDPCNVETYMNQLLDYANNDNDLDTVDLFFKSQIIHFYFVYIHPYFDINGRTSRTTSLWFLNNNSCYPYTIFNRSIPYNKRTYYDIIRKVKFNKNITPFIEFIALGTKLELEKEYVISSIESNCGYNLEPINKQILQYILTNNSNNTLLDFSTFYNKFNPNRNIRFINERLLEPLLEQKIILKGRNTSKQIFNEQFNYYFSINPDLLDIDKKRIKRLNLEKYTKHE